MTDSSSPTSTTPDLGELRDLAVALAVEAGAFVAARPAELHVGTKSSPTDIVTIMDQRSEALLRERLRASRPQDAVFGEEAGASSGSSGLTWVIDPIDGTVNYLYGIPEYAVSVALVEGDPGTPGAWRPLVGAVCAPELGVVIHAAVGGGCAQRQIERGNDVRGTDVGVRVRADVSLDQALVATGFSYGVQERREEARLVAEVLPRVRDIRRGGSAALDLCNVARGRLDGYFESSVNPWDIAAGMLCVAEASGKVGGYGRGTILDPGIVAAAPHVHDDLADLVGWLTSEK